MTCKVLDCREQVLVAKVCMNKAKRCPVLAGTYYSSLIFQQSHETTQARLSDELLDRHLKEMPVLGESRSDRRKALW